MTWIKLDDKCPRHPKISGLSDRAFRWWVQALCYASEFLTDGVLPAPFLKTVPAKVRAEIISAGLWLVRDEQMEIHDYLEHQTSRAEIDRERERNRQRRTGGVPAAYRRGDAGTTDEKPRPEVEAEAENRTQRSDPSSQNEDGARGGALIRSSLDVEKALRFNSFVGARLQVPRKLHGDFMRSLGGDDPDGTLRAWYAGLDAELESTREPIAPDVWKWLESRFKPWLSERVGEAEMAKFLAGGQ